MRGGMHKSVYIWNLESILDSMESGAVEMEVKYSLKIFAFDVTS